MIRRANVVSTSRIGQTRALARTRRGAAILHRGIPAQPGQAAFTPAAWQSLGGVTVTTHDGNAYPGIVRSLLATPDGRLYLGGTFGFAADRADPTRLPYGPQVNYANVVQWRPKSRSWASLGLVMGGKGMSMYQSRVNALAFDGAALTVGGNFQYVGAASAGLNKLAPADGWADFRADRNPQWGVPASSVNASVRSFVRTPQGLYAGGSFQLEGDNGQRVLLLDSAGKLYGMRQALAVSPAVAPADFVRASVDALLPVAPPRSRASQRGAAAPSAGGAPA